MPYNEQNRNGQWYGDRPMDAQEPEAWYEAEPVPEAPAEAPTEAPAAPEAQNPSGYFIPEAARPQSAQTQPVCCYTPGPSAGSGKAPVKPPKPSNYVHPVWRVLAIVAFGLLFLSALVGLIIGLVAAVNVVSSFEEYPFASGEMEDEDDFYDFFEDYFDDYYGPWDYDDDAYYPDEDTDVDEYFENYFDSTSDIDIPRADTNADVTLTLTETGADEKSLQEIYAEVSPSIVGLTTYCDGQEYGWGSGIIFTADGYILTNTHIIEGADAAKITTTDGVSYDAEYVGSDSSTDIAVLKIDASGLPCAVFADSADCLVGDDAIAIGNPLSEQYSGTMTTGIISGINRSVTNNGYEMTVLQTNAALNEGNSGGALLNACGQVIGITNMKIMFTYDGTVEGIGFAVPTAVIKPVVDSILQNGLVLGQPTLGIMAGPVSSYAMDRYDLPVGIYVSEVDERSDAYAQGLEPGDIITAVNGIEISSVDEVNSIKSGYAVGDSITCTVYRDGKTFDITFALVDKSTVE